jgi:hypothetical protein
VPLLRGEVVCPTKYAAKTLFLFQDRHTFLVSERVDQLGVSLPRNGGQFKTESGVSLIRNLQESQFSVNSSDQRSISGVALGGKVRLHESEHLNFTAIAQFNFASESPTSSFNVDPTLGVVWDYDGKGAISWFGALQLSSEGIKNDRTTFGQFAIGSTISISERLSIFTEYFNSISVSSNPEVYHPINGGFTFLVSPKIQFDLYAGVGLNKNTDHFIGSGLAILF